MSRGVSDGAAADDGKEVIKVYLDLDTVCVCRQTVHLHGTGRSKRSTVGKRAWRTDRFGGK